MPFVLPIHQAQEVERYPSQARSMNCSHRGSMVESMAVVVLSGLKKFR
jgi:hypothetical protein